MSLSERRRKLLELLCLRRHDTYGNLTNEFGVSKETIRKDIMELMCSYPVETVCGRFGGGVKVLDGYYCNQPKARKSLTSKEASSYPLT